MMPQAESWSSREGFLGRRESSSAAKPGSARWLEGAPPTGVPEQLAGLVHDARNMVAALELYCDLLEEPGVLAEPYRHYAGELRRVGAANRRLLESLSRLERRADVFPAPSAPAVSLEPARLRSRWRSDWTSGQVSGQALGQAPAPAPRSAEAAPSPRSLARGGYRRGFASGQTVENLAEELSANRNLLAAMAGHGVTVGMSFRGGACPVAIARDDLTRVLVNLVRNAAEAMPGGGHLQIALEEGPEYLTLSFTDNGPGIPEQALESIFSPGFSTHVGLQLEPEADAQAWPVQHRGLGLSIVRSLVSAAGGTVWAANRIAESGSAPGDSSPPHGAVLLIEFPLPAARQQAQA